MLRSKRSLNLVPKARAEKVSGLLLFQQAPTNFKRNYRVLMLRVGVPPVYVPPLDGADVPPPLDGAGATGNGAPPPLDGVDVPTPLDGGLLNLSGAFPSADLPLLRRAPQGYERITVNRAPGSRLEANKAKSHPRRIAKLSPGCRGKPSVNAPFTIAVGEFRPERFSLS